MTTGAKPVVGIAWHDNPGESNAAVCQLRLVSEVNSADILQRFRERKRSMNYIIREIRTKDNKSIEQVIRTCLIEYGANHEGTAWTDPQLSELSEAYRSEGSRYWVIETENGEIVGGTGIGRVEGSPDACELQKMYCLPKARGTGAAHDLIVTALDYAKEYYKKCYLETFSNMIPAQKFYKKHGFRLTDKRLGQTGHYACDVLFIKEL